MVKIILSKYKSYGSISIHENLTENNLQVYIHECTIHRKVLLFVSSYNLKDERKKFVIPFSYKFIFYQFQFMARQDIIVVLFTSTLDLFRNAKYVGAAISQMSIFLVLGTKNDSFVEN